MNSVEKVLCSDIIVNFKFKLQDCPDK